jgi:hypothetical protein
VDGIDQKVIECVVLRNLDASSVSVMSEVQCNEEARRQQSRSVDSTYHSLHHNPPGLVLV